MNSDLRAELLKLVEEDQATVAKLTRDLEEDEAFREESHSTRLHGAFTQQR